MDNKVIGEQICHTKLDWDFFTLQSSSLKAYRRLCLIILIINMLSTFLSLGKN